MHSSQITIHNSQFTIEKQKKTKGTVLFVPNCVIPSVTRNLNEKVKDPSTSSG